MIKITSDDCKEFLIKHFSLNSDIKLKRIRKYKDNSGCCIRAFSDSTGNIYMVKELSNGDLIINNDDPSFILKDNNVFDCKKFIKSIMKKMDMDDDYDFVDNTINKISSMSILEKKSIANQFNFYFPDMVYANDISTLNNGLDTSMFSNSGESYSIFIYYNKRNENTNEYITDILKGILPDFFDKTDEEHFIINDTNNFTVKMIIELLENLGFIYKNDKKADYSEQCMLMKLKLKLR